MGNKAKKTKLTNMLRGKERKKWKRVNMQSYIEVDKEDLYALKIHSRGKEQWESKQGNKCRKNNNRLKKIKVKKRRTP